MQEYEVDIRGVPHTLMLDDDDAAARNAQPVTRKRGSAADKRVAEPADKRAPAPADKRAPAPADK